MQPLLGAVGGEGPHGHPVLVVVGSLAGQVARGCHEDAAVPHPDAGRVVVGRRVGGTGPVDREVAAVESAQTHPRTVTTTGARRGGTQHHDVVAQHRYGLPRRDADRSGGRAARELLAVGEGQPDRDRGAALLPHHVVALVEHGQAVHRALVRPRAGPPELARGVVAADGVAVVALAAGPGGAREDQDAVRPRDDVGDHVAPCGAALTCPLHASRGVEAGHHDVAVASLPGRRGRVGDPADRGDPGAGLLGAGPVEPGDPACLVRRAARAARRVIGFGCWNGSHRQRQGTHRHGPQDSPHAGTVDLSRATQCGVRADAPRTTASSAGPAVRWRGRRPRCRRRARRPAAGPAGRR